MMISRFSVGRDGRTAYERRKGRKCHIHVMPFGELVWYKEIRRQKARDDKFNSYWMKGIWLGHSRSNNEVLIGTESGVVRAYAVKRLSADERWSAEAIKAMKGTPQQPDPKKPGLIIPSSVRFEEKDDDEEVEDETVEREVIRRRIRLSKKTRSKYGYTEDCEGCRAQKAGLVPRNHSETCRSRVSEEMKKTEEGARKIRQESQRLRREEKEQDGAVQRAENENEGEQHERGEDIQTETRKNRREKRAEGEEVEETKQQGSRKKPRHEPVETQNKIRKRRGWRDRGGR